MSAQILVVGQLPPPVHGSNIMTERFVTALRDVGYKPLLLQKTFSKREEEVNIFSYRKVIKAPLIILRLIRKIVSHNPRLCVFFLSLGPMSFLFDAVLLMLIRLFGIPHILYIHGVGVRRLDTDSGFLCRWIFRATVPYSAGALVLGERLKDDVLPYISSDRIFVLHNAIPDKEDISPNRDQHAGTVKVLFFSNLRPQKGVMEFLRMVKVVAAQCETVEFLIAGPCRSRKMEEEINSFIIDGKLTGRVRMLGALYDKEKEKVFERSHIFVFPSHSEAFPLVVLEAMQWGLPVVASDVGCVPEMVCDGETGYLIHYTDIANMAERVLLLVRNASLRQAMGIAGRKRIFLKYSMARYREELVKGINIFLSRF